MGFLKFIRLSNLLRQPATPAQKNLPEGCLIWGERDAFPLKWAKLVQESSAGSACISTLTDFIEGSGFSEKSLDTLLINSRGETFGEFHHQNVGPYTLYEAFAICVKYNREGKISEWFSIPVENCRLGIPDDKGHINKIVTNPYFGTGEYQKKWTQEYDVFNPSEAVVRAQQERDGKKYKGQILFFAEPKPLSRFYGLPEAFSSQFWMDIDCRIGEFHRNNLKNGFFQANILTFIGDPNAPSTDPEDQQWNEERTEFKSLRTMGERFNLILQQMEGSEHAGGIWAQWVSKLEEKPQIDPFPTNSNAELFKAIQELTTKNITIGTKVPAILANISEGVSLGGDGNTIRAAVKLMQQRAVKKQRALERVYKTLLSKMAQPYNGEVKIISYNPFPELGTIDANIWAALTANEKRQWIKENTEYPILEEQQVATQVAKTEKSFKNFTYANYPEKAIANAKEALKWKQANEGKCGSPAGWKRCETIAENKPMPYTDVKRTYNYLFKHQQFSNMKFSDSCFAVLYQAWGGTEMMNWAADKINMVEK